MQEEPFEDMSQEESVPKRPKPRRAVLTLVLTPIVVVTVIGTFALWFFRPYMIAHHPLALLITSPSSSHVLLVQERVDTLSYYITVIFRRLLLDPSYFFIGYWYGHAAVNYIKRYSRDVAAIAVKLEEWFPKFGWLLILLWPREIVMVMAGASTMPFWAFIVLDIIGVVASTVLIREFGYVIAPQVNWITEFFIQYWIPLTVLSLLVVGYQVWRGHKEGGGGMQTPGSIRRELEGDDSVDGINDTDDWDGDPLDRPRGQG